MRLTFETPDFYGYSVKFSPFSGDLLACVASLNYGLQGQGSLFILDHSPGLGIRCLRELEWKPDALFDLTWSELSPSMVWTSSANGTVQIWDTGDVKTDPIYRKSCRPVQVIPAHSSVVSSISWNQVRADAPSVLTSSWDRTIKLWDGVTGNPVITFTGHERLVYECSWSPLIPSTFASCSGDGTVRIWDKTQPPDRSSLKIDASRAEILSCDWCKYDSNILAYATSDSTIRILDLRSPHQGPFSTLTGHSRAVKKVRFNPHKKSILGSVSYDLTTRIWDFLSSDGSNAQGKSLLMTRQNHTEFVYGIDFNLHIPGIMADCGWDHYVVIVHDSAATSAAT